MSHGKCEPTNTNAADYKLYARFDAGETLESVLASPPTTKHNKVILKETSGLNTECGWRGERSIPDHSDYQ